MLTVCHERSEEITNVMQGVLGGFGWGLRGFCGGGFCLGFEFGLILGFVGGFVLVLMCYIVSYVALDVTREVHLRLMIKTLLG